jgi:hypothetical protein
MNTIDPAALAQSLGGARREGRRWRATCPVCQKHTFTIGLSDDGQHILIKCWGGCAQQELIARLRQLQLWPAPSRNGHTPAPPATNGHAPAEATIDPLAWLADYCGVDRATIAALPIEARGDWLAFVFPSGAAKLRKAGSKDIRWDIPAGASRPALWPLLPPGERMPEPMVLCESETDAIVARFLGLPAFAGTAGASTPLKAHEAEALAARGVQAVTLLYDADEAGRVGAQKQAEALTQAGIEVAIVDLAQAGLADPLSGQKDLRDVWLAARARNVPPEAVRQALLAAARPGAPADAGPAGEATIATPAIVAPPAFPIGAIPDPHRTYLQQAATALDCDVALVAAPYLAIAAGVLGCRVELQLTRSWTERAILWTAVVAPPGSSKSPALRLAMQPMLELQHEAYEAWREDVARFDEEKRAYDQERAAAKRSGGGMPHAPAPEPPAELEHYYTADCTLEGITRMLGHPRSRTPGVVVVRDELVAWVKAFDAYSPRGERQVWLSLWAGAPVKSDRAHREPYVIPRPAVSVTGGMTPDLLPALEEEAGQRDGFLERILFVLPPCRPMALVDAEIAAEVQAAVRDSLRALRTCPEGVACLSREAYSTYATWHQENATYQERATGLLLGFAAKLPGHVARLALVLHALAHPEDPAGTPLGRETVAGAIALGEYFRAHFERAARHFGVAAQVQDGAALRLYRTLQRLGGSATGRELDDAGLRAGPERDRAAQTLQAAGLLSVTAEPHAGPGRPTLRFALTGNLSNLSNLSGGVCVDDGDDGAASPGVGAEQERWEEFEL